MQLIWTSLNKEASRTDLSSPSERIPWLLLISKSEPFKEFLIMKKRALTITQKSIGQMTRDKNSYGYASVAWSI